MSYVLEDSPALLLVDIQEGLSLHQDYYGGTRNNPDAEANAGKLLDHWRAQGWPIFHIQHCSTENSSPLRPGQPLHNFQEVVKPIGGEPIVQKSVNSGFIGTDLEKQLRGADITQVVVAGLTTDHCVSTTTRMAANLGFDTLLVHDATATYSKEGHNGETYPAQLVHDTAIASLKDEFATVVSVEEILTVEPVEK
ncbi:MAG TPA: cysteine hydrolase [Cytophagales bacterium]|nr:cysteine hydrolase [Cytophagales bacterium]HAA17809.1 cysteine hydrolase [Cytophagales bacterium]HAP58837.1 cysteine hydrolase [Cytophagales bacterium]